MLGRVANRINPQDSFNGIGECKRGKGDGATTERCRICELFHAVMISHAVSGCSVGASLGNAKGGAVAAFVLDALDDLRPLRDEVRGVRLVCFLLAVFQTLALVIL